MHRIEYLLQAHEQLWLECAQKLTTVIQQIIEFAKMVPGFMKLTQDDQIVLLKAGKVNSSVYKLYQILQCVNIYFSRYFLNAQSCSV